SKNKGESRSRSKSKSKISAGLRYPAALKRPNCTRPTQKFRLEILACHGLRDGRGCRVAQKALYDVSCPRSGSVLRTRTPSPPRRGGWQFRAPSADRFQRRADSDVAAAAHSRAGNQPTDHGHVGGLASGSTAGADPGDDQWLSLQRHEFLARTVFCPD